MWFTLAVLAVLSTEHYEGDVADEGGAYLELVFEVPAGTQEIRIAHSDGDVVDILDWGVWSPDGFRGWGGGLTEDAVIGVEQSSRGYLPGPIRAGRWTLVIGKARVDTGGARYAVDVTCFDAPSLPVLPRAPFAPVVVKAERRWYSGDFHVHSRESGDSTATLDEIVGFAQQRGIDFVNLSDHNTVSQHALQAAFMASRPEFLLLRGAEITTYRGHGNAVGLSAYVDHRTDLGGRAIGAVLDDVAAQGAIFLVNHPTLNVGGVCIGCAWVYPDTDWTKVAGIELITGNYELSQAAFTPQAIAMWDKALDTGARIAAIGGSDDHDAGRELGPMSSPIGSPTTLVLADNLSEAAIIDAVREGRTIVQLRSPIDPRVDVELAGPSGTAGIGDEVDGIENVRLTIRVTGGNGMFAQVWRNGEVLAPDLPISGVEATATFDDAPGAGDFRYRVELIDDANRRVVVTSHIYVRAIAGAGGCGCGAGGDLAGGALPLLAMLAVRRRRRRRARPDLRP